MILNHFNSIQVWRCFMFCVHYVQYVLYHSQLVWSP